MEPDPFSAMTEAVILTPPDERQRKSNGGQLRSNPVLQAFSSLFVAQLIAMSLGSAFWLWAARTMSPAELGASAALVNAMTMIATVCSLGAPVLAATELPTASTDERAAFIKSFCTLIGLVSIVAGLIFWAVAPHVSETFRIGFRGAVSGPAFILSLAATAIALLTDQAALAARRNTLPVVRNAATSVLRFPLVAVAFFLVGQKAEGVTSGWASATVGLTAYSLVVVAARGAGEGRRTLRDAAALLRRYVSVGYRNFALFLALNATGYVLPLVGAATLPPERYAELSVAWLFGSIIFVPPLMLANALFAGAGHMEDEAFLSTGRKTLPLAAALSLLLCLATLLLGTFALRLYGARYADHAAHLLFLIMWAGPGLVVKDHLFAVARVQRRLTLGLAMAPIALVSEVAGCAIGAAVGGATGLCAGWVIGISLPAATELPLVVRWLWPHPSGPPTG